MFFSFFTRLQKKSFSSETVVGTEAFQRFRAITKNDNLEIKTSALFSQRDKTFEFETFEIKFLKDNYSTLTFFKSHKLFPCFID